MSKNWKEDYKKKLKRVPILYSSIWKASYGAHPNLDELYQQANRRYKQSRFIMALIVVIIIGLLIVLW